MRGLVAELAKPQVQVEQFLGSLRFLFGPFLVIQPEQDRGKLQVRVVVERGCLDSPLQKAASRQDIVVNQGDVGPQQERRRVIRRGLQGFIEQLLRLGNFLRGILALSFQK